jgi:putative peptide zinc metalloprotease protein
MVSDRLTLAQAAASPAGGAEAGARLPCAADRPTATRPPALPDRGGWPALREDLRLHEGPAMADGRPTWTLEDPVRHRFVRIDWITREVLRRWWLGTPELIAGQVTERTALHIDASHVLQVMQFAREHQLLEQAMPAESVPVRGGGGWLRWLLHHYLFVRVPLFDPEPLLKWLLPWLRPLGGVSFQRATFCALVFAVVLAWRDADALHSHIVDLMTWRGVLLFAVTLVAVKIAHELGHALVARHHGCRVPSMGLAFVVLWPMAYTDTSDVWRLRDSRARLAVALAGVRTELTIAAWSLLAWSCLPDGAPRSAAFLLATTTWISTVAVNLSPFMRFDGYFALCDWLDQPNLHDRSFAMTRWWLRRLLLGWQAPPPETLDPVSRRLMIVFAVATWAYRLAVYLAIAWLVYQFSVKVVGILLFVVEIGWFIVLPIVRELRVWAQARAAWAGGARARLWWWLGPCLLMIGFVPLPSYEGAGAVLQPARHLAVRLPATAPISVVHVGVGQQVAAGAPLLEASALHLEQRRELVRARIRQLRSQLAGAGFEPAQLAQWASLQEQLATAQDEERAISEEMTRYQPRAPFDGLVVDIEPSLRAGTVAPGAQPLLWLASEREWRVVVYASDAAMRALQIGDAARFVADARPWQSLPVRVVSVSPHPALVLSEPMLAQEHGGAVAATLASGKQWIPRDQVYRVEMAVEADPDLKARAWRGHVRLEHRPQSAWQRLWTSAGVVLARELGF